MLNNWKKGPVYKKRKSPSRLRRDEERFLKFQKKVVEQSSRDNVTDGETDRAKLPVSESVPVSDTTKCKNCSATCTDSLSPVSSHTRSSKKAGGKSISDEAVQPASSLTDSSK